MDKRDKWEDIVKSKLENFEVDTQPEDWNAILDRLPKTKHAVNMYIWRYAAAVIVVLLLVGSYFLIDPEINKPIVADVKDVLIDSILKEGDITNPDEFVVPLEEDINNLVADHNNDIIFDEPVLKQSNTGLRNVTNRTVQLKDRFSTEKLNSERTVLDTQNKKGDINNIYVGIKSDNNRSKQALLADATPPVFVQKKTKKRWGIGMGGGSYSVGTDGFAVPDFTSPNNLLSYDAAMLKQSANAQLKQDISHKRPISFGVGVGYALNDRWALQSGLYYTMLRSEWWYVNEYQGVSKQKLHFLGVPVGVSYKILEWKKFNLYASAGAMTEWNFDGRIKTNFYTDSQRETVVASKNESIRMKEWQWSVNGKVGVTYPLVKFLNAFVEGGGNYYFDNGSNIETIRSEKPFHMSLQAGIRLGF